MADKLTARWHIAGHAGGAIPAQELGLQIAVEDQHGDVAKLAVGYSPGRVQFYVTSQYGVDLEVKDQDSLTGSALLVPRWRPEPIPDLTAWEDQPVAGPSPSVPGEIPTAIPGHMAPEDFYKFFGEETPKSTTSEEALEDRPDCLTVMTPRPEYPSSKSRDLIVYHLVVRGQKNAHPEGAAALALQDTRAMEDLENQVRRTLSIYGLINPQWTVEVMGITEAKNPPEEAAHDPSEL